MDSILCEEFGCLPSELDDESPRLLLRIVELRNYSRAFRAVEEYSRQEKPDPKQAPRGKMVNWVYENLSIRLKEEEVGNNG